MFKVKYKIKFREFPNKIRGLPACWTFDANYTVGLIQLNSYYKDKLTDFDWNVIKEHEIMEFKNTARIFYRVIKLGYYVELYKNSLCEGYLATIPLKGDEIRSTEIADYYHNRVVDSQDYYEEVYYKLLELNNLNKSDYPIYRNLSKKVYNLIKAIEKKDYKYLGNKLLKT